MTYNGFEYNEHGVCINPDIPYTSESLLKKDYFEINVSETTDGWTCGWSWVVFYSDDGRPRLTGGGCPCSPTFNTVHKTRSEAIINAATVIRKGFVTRNKHKAVAELDRIISEESKPKIRQMTIFDYL